MTVNELIRDLSLCENMRKTEIYFKDKKGRLYPIKGIQIKQEVKTKGRTLKKTFVVDTVYLTDAVKVKDGAD